MGEAPEETRRHDDDQEMDCIFHETPDDVSYSNVGDMPEPFF